MKKILIIVSVALCILLVGCSKEPPIQPTDCFVDCYEVTDENKYTIQFRDNEAHNVSVKFGFLGAMEKELNAFSIYYNESLKMLVADLSPNAASLGMPAESGNFKCISTGNELKKSEYVTVCYVVFDESKFKVSISELEADANNENYCFPIQICLN